MTTETETAEVEVDLAALVRAAAEHPDPWFSALARTYLTPPDIHQAGDPELVQRLEAQQVPAGYTPPEVVVEDAVADGPHGPVPVRVYRPAGERSGAPAFVWCHGGGFVGGDLEMPEADATGREVAARAGTVVVSVDYRLATNGVHFPVPHDDALAAYEWAVDRFGPAVIGGASAGAALTAGVAVRLRDEGRPPCGVVLLYPLVHPALPAPSDELAEKLTRLTASHAFRGPGFRPMLENYLGASVEEASPYALAGIADLTDYPPTLIINDEFDGLRASGEAFALELEAAGVPVTQLLAPDVLHGHINSPWLPQAQQSYADMASWIAARA
jgi:acetyl esterase/lipase